MDNLINLSNIYYNKALKYVRERKISKAIPLMEKSLKYYSKDIQTLNLMGLCQYVLCHFDKANFYWSKSLECNIENNRAKHYLDYLNSDECQKIIDKYNLAISSIQRDEYEKAINILCEINTSNKELIEPYVIIGLCYYELGKYKLAKDYIAKAVNMDRDNVQYLKYLNKINDESLKKDINILSKRNNILNYILSMLLIITIVFFIKEHNDYTNVLNRSLEYEKMLDNITVELENSKNSYNILKGELEKEKRKSSKHNNETDLKDKELKDKEFGGDFFQLFNNAILAFKEQKYNEAVEIFQYIISRSDEQTLVAEATYFTAVCFEKMEDFLMAGEYYEIYINKFARGNYYDDSLYNYGLLLYRQGDKQGAKQVLYELTENVPNSIFINSKVKYILKQEDGE